VSAAERRLRALLVAPPGAGKGTQAARLSRHFGVPSISTGDVFRREVAAGTELGREVAAYLDSGDLVPDELVGQAVRREVLAAVAASGGYLLDGFPRTVGQAEAAHADAVELDLEADAVVTFDVPRPVLLERLLNRAGAGGRSDDDSRTIPHRLDVYDLQTMPLLAYYDARGLLIRIDANRPVDEVTVVTIDSLEQALAERRITVNPE
jgi:adenylate kinase